MIELDEKICSERPKASRIRLREGGDTLLTAAYPDDNLYISDQERSTSMTNTGCLRKIKCALSTPPPEKMMGVLKIERPPSFEKHYRVLNICAPDVHSACVILGPTGPISDRMRSELQCYRGTPFLQDIKRSYMTIRRSTITFQEDRNNLPRKGLGSGFAGCLYHNIIHT